MCARVAAWLPLALVLLARPAGATLHLEPMPARLSGAVYAVTQSADGFLWLGTPDGLLRFDGVDMQPVPIGSAHARLLLAARDGSLWIATGAGFVELWVKTGRLRLTLTAGRPVLLRRFPSGRIQEIDLGAVGGVPVRALGEAADGTMWVGTERGLARWKDGTLRTFSTTDGLPEAEIVALATDQAGRVFVGTNRGLSVARDGRFEPTAITTQVAALATDARGRVLVGLPNEVLIIDGQTTLRAPGPALPLSFADDGAGGAWLGAEGGLYRVRVTEGRAEVTRADMAQLVLGVLRDREGSLWLATRTGGLLQLRPRTVMNLGRPEGLPTTVAFAVLAARDGGVWATIQQAVARWDANGELSVYRSGAAYPPGALRAIAEAPDGSIWFSRLEGGLVRHAERSFTSFGAEAGVPAVVRSLLFDRAGDLWLSWSDGEVARFAQGRVERAARRDYKVADGLCAGPLENLAERAGGGMWAAGEGGLAEITNAGVRCHGGPAVSALLEETDGTTWLGVRDGGLVRLRGGRMTTISPRAGLPATTPYSISDDGHGHLWMTTTLGVYRVAKEALHAVAEGRRTGVSVLLFDGANGLRSPECTNGFRPGAAVDRQGQLWVPTLAGVSILPSPERGPMSLADVSIDQVQLDGRAVAAPIQWRRGGSVMRVAFVAPSFLGPGSLSFEHLLEGRDRDWQPTRDRVVEFAGLAPGEYTLRVRARDRLGRVTGRVAHLDFRVPPPWHRSWQFLLGCAAAVAAAAGASVRARLRRLEAQSAAVQAERARIARDLHDALAQAFAGMSLKLESLRLLSREAPDELRREIDATKQIVDDAREQARRSVWDIRAAVTGVPNLRAVLERVLAEVPRSRGVKVSLVVEGNERALPPPVDQELHAITREALLNAIRHGDPQRITVQALWDEEGLHLSVDDDGKGLPSEDKRTRGAGLIGMAERAARIGGEIQVVPRSRGQGVRVHLFVPTAALPGGT